MQAWVWTTFNTYQWDVDWSNPDVFCEYADVVLFLANLGVEVLRLDAIAFIWKRIGTNCQNQPEVHSLTQALRTVARIACPAVLFKAEAIVGPRDLPAYLGTGSHHGKVSDLAYHNGLMVQVWSMLASRDVRLASHALRQLPPTPSNTAWITYARCHDDIGWAIDDGDAAAVGLSGWGHRTFLSDFYTGEFPGSWARGLEFQSNPANGDRRISGALASLAGVECQDPLRRRPDPAGARPDPRVRGAAGALDGRRGGPAQRPGLGVGARPRRTTTGGCTGRGCPGPARRSPRTPTASGCGCGRCSRARADLQHLHASISAEVLQPRDPGVLLVLRRHPLGPMLGAYNVTDEWREVPMDLLHALGLGSGPLEHVSGERLRARRRAPGQDRSVHRLVADRVTASATVAGVEISKPDKVLFPDDGITKLDLARYYADVADVMLRHVRGRPVNMERFPNGIGEQGFYEKKRPQALPRLVRLGDRADLGGHPGAGGRRGHPVAGLPRPAGLHQPAHVAEQGRPARHAPSSWWSTSTRRSRTSRRSAAGCGWSVTCSTTSG